ncbi:hypothetical protein JCM5296_002507, partial [Sporobolomyces johnsonii]
MSMSSFVDPATGPSKRARDDAPVRPNKLKKGPRATRSSLALRELSRPSRPLLKRASSSRAIFGGALDIFSRRTQARSLTELDYEEAEEGYRSVQLATTAVPKVSLRQMPSLLSLSSLIRGTSKSSTDSTSPTSSSFPSNEIPPLISPTDSNFSSAISPTDSNFSTATTDPIDVPFSPTATMSNRNSWEGDDGQFFSCDEDGDDSRSMQVPEGVFSPVIYEGIWGKPVWKGSGSGHGP